MRVEFCKNGIQINECQYILLIGFLLLLDVTFGNDNEAAPESHTLLPAKVVWGVTGKDVELPCDVTPPIPSDSVKMIFWFKDSTGMPLYSLDARGGPLSEASHLAMTDELGSRSYFIIDEEPAKARLRIQKINAEDEGVFRCRVDFINSPTRNFKVNLTLVVQPSQPKVFDVEGKEVNSDAGPFLEGRELFLSCQVNGGRPRPSVSWWHNGTVLDGVIDSSLESYKIVNDLVISRLPRNFYGTYLECKASSSHLAGDIVRKISLKVYLKPNKVKIVSPNDLLSVNKVHTIRCETSGSSPPAKLSWFLGGKPIKSSTLTEEVTDSFTTSLLTLNVEAEDDGKYLVCRADNPRYPGGSTEDRRQIHVAYPPKVAVKSDTGLTSPVKEGANVVFKCETVARPDPHGYNWYHDGHLIQYNNTAGLQPMDNILRMAKVTKSSDGQYSCSAANTEGETYSSPFTLTVQYAPRCAKGFEVMRVGALSHEALTVDCHVDALPEVTRFSWTYNTSKGVLPVQGARIHNENGVSTLHFVPGTADLESLACWATNSVGRQEKPCLFYIIPASSPESPHGCRLRNSTTGGVEVTCVAGNDGGLPQSFVLEVTDIAIPAQPPSVTTLSDQGERSLPLYRVLGEHPTFRLHSLKPDREYQLLVYAVNAKGRSAPPVVLSKVKVEVPVDTVQENGSTVIPIIAGEGSPPTSQSLTLILLVLTAIASLLIVGIISVATILACRKRPPAVTGQSTTRHKPPDDMELSEAGFSEGFQRRSAHYRASLYLQEIDRNSRQATGPDLILTPTAFCVQQSSEY
ncbi:hemicentin-2 isoform X2 [Photinus pyralis]|uniref:hemicentin-2 isoform X2 n=1 Tax=Photinus pyralis TaxID=7054 RepID=UPI00126740F4|nr:hemicentin-2 isoform X2 [Photinus pyralis]